MGFNTFRIIVLVRVIALSLTAMAGIYLWLESEKLFSAFLIGVGLIAQIVSLFYYVERTNRKLGRFLEHIKYSDFTSGFASDNHLGRSFRQLNKAFNEVLDAFREERSEKEEHLQYLNTVVQHVETGLISFDKSGQIQLMNTAAHRLLRTPQIRHIDELATSNPNLDKKILQLDPGERVLFRNSDNEELAVTATEIRMKGKLFKLISFHNIQAELQKKELDAWQNLTKVLRHEIMNSIAPISSLTATLRDIVDEELADYQEGEPIDSETIEDIKEALATIEKRSHGLARFVNAYKEFTQIPKPNVEIVSVTEIINNVYQLMKGEVKDKSVDLSFTVEENTSKITADPELIEMVLINLVKNAIQAVNGGENAKVEILGGLNENLRTYIKVVDNGPGIIPDAIERIFIPFYTTKKEGSGIGLALSRQILQQHKGSLTVQSELNVRTEFVMTF